MNNTYHLKQKGNGKGPHILEDTETKKKISLCSCGCTDSGNGECDGTHNIIAEKGCCGKENKQCCACC